MQAVSPLTPMATLRWGVVKPLIDEIGPQRVLEVGCGQGSFGSRLASNRQYVGVEPDERSCAVARERIAPLGGTVVNGVVEDLPVTADFDLVCAFEVIEHLEDDVAALTDWRSRVRPGGSLLVSVPAWPDRFTAMDEMVGHYRRYRPEDLDRVMREAGWIAPRHVLYGWPLGYALESVRVRIAQRRGKADEDGGAPADMDTRSAASGRLFQPRRLAGTAVRVGAAPFVSVQKLRPHAGTGLVAVAHRPR